MLPSQIKILEYWLGDLATQGWQLLQIRLFLADYKMELTLLCPELDLWYGVARQHLGVGQRRLDSQDPGHPHRTVPSDSVRYTFDFSQT